MPSVTMFGIYYAPDRSGNAPYTTGTAEFLAANGWDVTMVTGMPHYPEWKKRRAPAQSIINGVRIIRANHYVPSNPTTLGRGAMEVTWTMGAWRPLLSRLNTDVVVGITPTLAAAWLAAATAKRSHSPLVLWFQDLMGQAAVQSGIDGADRIAGAVKRIEHRLALGADQIVMCADGYQSYFEEADIPPERLSVVRNWSTMPKPTKTRSETLAQHGLSEAAVVALHSGNMGAKQGLDVVLDAAENRSEVTWVLQGDGSERRSLEASAKERGLTNVVFLPSLESEDLSSLLSAADVLLLTQLPAVTDMSLPSKLTSYLTSGTPVVAAVHPDSEAALLLREAGSAQITAAGDGAALASAVTSAIGCSAPMVNSADLFGSPEKIEKVLLQAIEARTRQPGLVG